MISLSLEAYFSGQVEPSCSKNKHMLIMWWGGGKFHWWKSCLSRDCERQDERVCKLGRENSLDVME